MGEWRLDAERRSEATPRKDLPIMSGGVCTCPFDGTDPDCVADRCRWYRQDQLSRVDPYDTTKGFDQGGAVDG